MTLNLKEFINKLNNTPKAIEFSETIALIESLYNFTPTAFTNEDLHNEAGKNSGSCKILAFAKMHKLSKDAALACFGKYYFDEVLGDPDGSGHQNIRNLIEHGLEGVSFEGEALKEK